MARYTIGEDGVRYQRRVECLGEAVATLHTAVREKEKAIPPASLGELSIDDFCALQPVDDIGTKLEELRKSVSVLRDALKVQSTPEFEVFALPLELEELRKSVSVLRDALKVQSTPEFEVFALPLFKNDAIRGVLRSSLPGIEQAAVDAVNAHFASLGERGERWVADGVKFLGEGESCPFCGQGVSGSSLIAHYRAYFLESYREHKSNISAVKTRLEGDFGGDALARIQRALQRVRERHGFWAKYVELSDFTVDVEEVAAAWVGARDGLLVRSPGAKSRCTAGTD